MGKVKTVRVAQSVVTGIRIEPSGALTVQGVDQDKAGNSVRHHQLSTVGGTLELPGRVADALTVIREFAQLALDEA